MQEYTLSFAPNEFVGRDNVIGFIQTTPESRNFLSIDNVNNQKTFIDPEISDLP